MCQSRHQEGLRRRPLWRSSCLLLVVPLSWLVVAAEQACEAADPPSDSAALGVMAQGYLQNRESFKFLSCRFQLVRGEANSVEAALRGEIRQTIAQSGVWKVRPGAVFYHLDCDEELVQRALDQRASVALPPSDELSDGLYGVAVPCNAHHYLASDAHGLHFTPLIKGANIYADEVRDPGLRITPFGMDLMGDNESANPGSLLQQCLAGTYVARFVGSKTVLGRSLMLAEMGRSSEKFTNQIGLDPERGFLPAYMQATDERTGKPAYEAYITDVRTCSQGRWFPLRSVVVWNPQGPPPRRVQEIRVVELNVDSPPTDEEFYLALPQGTQVSVPTLPYWATMQADEQVAVADLAGLYQRCVSHGKEYAAAAHLTPSTSGDTRRRLLIIAVNVLLLSALTVYLVFRRYRQGVAHA